MLHIARGDTTLLEQMTKKYTIQTKVLTKEINQMIFVMYTNFHNLFLCAKIYDDTIYLIS